MPATQALNKSLVEEWDRFEKRTSLDASLAVSNGPFSVDVNASQTASCVRKKSPTTRSGRRSFLYGRYTFRTRSACPTTTSMSTFRYHSASHRRDYAKFFERYGTHFIPRAWVGGKASLALTISKQTQMTKSEIQAGIKASMVGAGGGSVNTSNQKSKEKLQSNSQCTVFGKGGDEFKVVPPSTLDNALYNEWLATVKDNPQVIEFEAVGIWTLFQDRAKAQALMDAYKDETVFSSLRCCLQPGQSDPLLRGQVLLPLRSSGERDQPPPADQGSLAPALRRGLRTLSTRPFWESTFSRLRAKT